MADQALSSNSFQSRVVVPLLAFLLPTVFCLIVIEIGLRLSGFISPVLRAEMFEWSATDKALPYWLKPNYTGSYAGVPVNVGADGNRRVPRPNDSRTNKSVVLLGDSVVFGQGLKDDQTIAARLQTRMPNVHAVSIAAPGYTSANEEAALLRYPGLDTVRAVVVVYVRNDITFDNDHFKLAETNGRIHYMGATVLHRITHYLHDTSRVFHMASEAAKRINFILSRQSTIGSFDIDMPALYHSMDAIQRIAQLCAERNIKLLVAIYRDGLFYQAPGEWNKYETAVIQSLNARQLPAAVLSQATSELQFADYRISWNDDGHPSPRAADLIAGQIADELRRMDVDHP